MCNLVDSHCHIPLLAETQSVEEILAEAKNHRIIHMLCVAIDLVGSPEIIQLAKSYDMVSASVGVHPNTRPQNKLTIDEITELYFFCSPIINSRIPFLCLTRSNRL